MKCLIDCLPKAELHLHIEGTFEPELMFEIAERNGVLDSLPFKDLAAAKLAYKFEDLQSFLDIYYAGCAVLLHEKLKVFEGQLEEKMRELLSHDLLITINADDPAYFGGYENDNFQYMAEKVGVKNEGIYSYCCNGFKAAFIPDEQKQAYIAQVDAAYAEVMGPEALQAAKAHKAAKNDWKAGR